MKVLAYIGNKKELSWALFPIKHEGVRYGLISESLSAKGISEERRKECLAELKECDESLLDLVVYFVGWGISLEESRGERRRQTWRETKDIFKGLYLIASGMAFYICLLKAWQLIQGKW